MANESTSSTLSELYTEIVAEALFVASERSIMRPLVRNYAVTGGGKSVEVPITPLYQQQQYRKHLIYLTQQ